MNATFTLPPSSGRNRNLPLTAGLLACLALYTIDAVCLAFVPNEGRTLAANIAVPFDLMVCVPAAFYLLVIKPRKLSPVAAIPVIYAGFVASMLVMQPGSFSLLTVLLPMMLAVEAVILVREIARFLRVFRAARKESTRPIVWFEKPFFELSRNETASRLCALECSIWYYVLASWRSKADVPNGARPFSCHKESGYLALSGVIMALLPIEALVTHLLVAKYCEPAAIALTVLTAYTLVWFIGNTRAVVLNPLLVDDTSVTVRWGAYFSERVPFASIARIDRREEPDVPKSERLNMAVMGARPCWIVLHEPRIMRTLLGKPRAVRAINVSPDNASDFEKSIAAQLPKR